MTKILAVDDNVDSLYLLEWLLKDKGFEVVTAKSGDEALTIVEEQKIDLIISDVLMPGMDGFTLCWKLKLDERHRTIPLIIYTATYTGSKDEKLAFEMGADKFIIKPAKPELLVQSIKELLKRGSDQSALETLQEKTEEDILKLYNERLVRKLEQKMLIAEKELRARIETEKELSRKRKILNKTQSIGKIGGWEWDNIRNKMYWTEETYRIHDIDSECLEDGSLKRIDQSLLCYNERDRELIIAAFEQCKETGEPYDFECELTTFKNRRVFVRTEGKGVIENGVVIEVSGYIQDITEKKQADMERDALREQLNKTQKLETIGQLAGGIAHDYNNMLTIILNFVEMAISEAEPNSSMFEYLQEIRKAAQRSAVMTGQLLTFARKQPIKPVIVDLNFVINEMYNMMRKLIAEDVSLKWIAGDNLWQISIDSSQVDQVLANLLINAQESMVNKGKIVLETENVVLDNDVNNNAYVIPKGKYVLLKVSDTGCGMTEDTLNKLFLPFFSTKGVGKNTGLGLATVFGITKQNNAFITVESEVGKGSSFSIYFPKIETKNQQEDKKVQEAKTHGRERILLVDDEEGVLEVVSSLLERYGYSVIAENSATRALQIAIELDEQIDILITDIIMPDMNGYELLEKIRDNHHSIKCLFISGYTNDVINQRCIIDKDIHFLQKPFLAKTMAEKIREIFDHS